MTPHPIPDAALESDIAILGKKGRGKSYTARGLVERLLDRGRQVVVLDPLSTWWGLKAGPNAYPIPVIGGPHGDLPIDDRAGEALGRYLATTDASVVIDLGELRKAELVRFATPFLEELYTGNRKPIWLVLEEADVFAPQQPQPDTARLLGEVDRIARRGRNFGFRLISLTQRPARLNKDVLTQLSTLIALGITSPQDRDAIKAWVEGAGDRDKAKQVLETLASLQVGEGWVWAPDQKILERVTFPKIRTLDTSATPKAGEKRAVAKVRKDVDVAALHAAMSLFSSTNEEAKRDKALAQSAGRGGSLGATPSTEDLAVAEQRGYTRGHTTGFDEGVAVGWAAAAEATARALSGSPLRAQKAPRVDAAPVAATKTRPQAAPSTASRPDDGAPVSASRRRILDGLAWLATIGLDTPDKTMLAHFVGVSPTSGGYFNNLGALRGGGLIDYPAGGTVALTVAGAAIGVAPEKPPTHEAVMALIGQRIPAPMMRVLETAAANYPNAVAKDDLAVSIGVSPTSGGYFNNLGRLRSMSLVTYPEKGSVRAADLLFPSSRLPNSTSLGEKAPHDH